MSDKLLEEQKHHYFLVTGELFFTLADDPEKIRTTMMNAVLPLPTRHIPVKGLGRAQEMLQMSLHKLVVEKQKQDPPKIHEAIIYSLSYMGEMTPSEFAAGTSL